MDLEADKKKIEEQASLFEVQVPEFKHMRNCKKELKQIKQLWDMVFVVR